jgi:glycosyltransferase involved in cell wall biosynthesis
VSGRVAFVPPRFGSKVVGGSETVTREIATGLAARGWDVEVLTTRVVDHYTWANDLPEGVSTEDGVTVRRFSTVHQVSRCGRRAQLLIQDGTMPPLDDQWTWVSWRFRVPDLFHHLLRHGDAYDALVFSPYLFWTTTACMSTVASRAVVMPCLHDESYARLEVVRPVLADPASVWFLSEPEHDLAHRLGPVAGHHTVTGAGVDVPSGYDPGGFRARHGLERPFVLYAGRREKDKGWDWLVETFAEAVRRGGLDDVDLVTIGVGEVRPAANLAGRVVDLGFLPDSERNDAFAAALAYLQPSRMESFSRTVMEAWLAGTPVLAIDGSEVVAWHCERSGGGAIFANGSQLHDHLLGLANRPDDAAGMAARGRQYVLDNYAWPVVLDRMEADLRWLAGRPDR